MASKEYQRQYRLDNPEKYKEWDKKYRERRELKMQADTEYRERILASKRKSNKKSIEKMKADPASLEILRKRRRNAMRKWWQGKQKLKRVLSNMSKLDFNKPIEVKSVKPILPKRLTKQQAYTDMQQKIARLEYLITIPEIRDNKINQLKAEFNNIYGAV